MGTINRRLFTEVFLANGFYPGDPQCHSLWTYYSPEGEKNYKVCYSDIDVANVMASPFCQRPKLLWSRENGRTAEGERFAGEVEDGIT